MTVPFDREAAAAFLDAMWGGHQGWAALAYGHDGYWDANGKYQHAKEGWRPQSYRWPNERARILDDIAARLASGRVDVYAAPLLRKHPKREKGNSAHYDLVWADADLVDLAAIEPLCPMVVNSGRDGHAHVYVRLAADVSPEEREALARGLMAHAGDCDPKIADNDVLRVPGTLNFKTDPPGRVTWHIPPGEHAKRWEASALAEALGVTLTPEELPLERPSRATVTPPGEPRTVVTPFQKPRTPELSTALARNTGDRSADIAAVWGAASRERPLGGRAEAGPRALQRPRPHAGRAGHHRSRGGEHHHERCHHARGGRRGPHRLAGGLSRHGPRVTRRQTWESSRTPPPTLSGSAPCRYGRPGGRGGEASSVPSSPLLSPGARRRTRPRWFGEGRTNRGNALPATSAARRARPAPRPAPGRPAAAHRRRAVRLDRSRRPLAVVPPASDAISASRIAFQSPSGVRAATTKARGAGQAANAKKARDQSP